MNQPKPLSAEFTRDAMRSHYERHPLNLIGAKVIRELEKRLTVPRRAFPQLHS